MNAYEAKQEAKRDRLEAAADRAQARSNAAYKRADLREEASGIPLGQPILVGHHSESRHRNAIKRADNAMRRSIEEGKRADELRAKAASVGTGGVSSDDPDAPEKLSAKIKEAEEAQDFMKAANRIVRAAHKAGVADQQSEGFGDYLAKLQKVSAKFDATTAETLIKPDFAGRIGFADYQLKNNNANIRRMKQRLAQLEANRKREGGELVFDGVKVVENVDENRVQFIFDGKPAANIRSLLKSHAFRWAPSAGAWQRQLNNAGIWAAKQVVRQLKEWGEV